MTEYTSARLSKETLKAIHALHNGFEDTNDLVIQRVIRFYLAKHTEHKKSTGRKKE
jgi:hypothetical protein